MAEQVVELSPGESKLVSFEAIPQEAKTYQVSVNGLAGSFNAVEPAPVPFTFSNVWVQRVRCESATAWNTLDFGCTISNPTSRSITHTLKLMYRSESKYGYSDPKASVLGAFTLTLNPGQSYNCNIEGNYYDAEDRRWRCAILCGFSAGVPYGGCAFLRDEDGNDSPQKCV